MMDPGGLNDSMAKAKAEMEKLRKEIEELKAEVTRLKMKDQNDTPESVQTDQDCKENGECEEVESESPPPETALITDCVLVNVFSYLDFPDLKSARLVCTKWAEVSSPRFLSKARMMAYNMDIFDRPMRDFEAAFPSDSDPQHTFKSLIIRDMALFSGMMRRNWLAFYGYRLTHLQLGYFLPEDTGMDFGWMEDYGWTTGWTKPEPSLSPSDLKHLLAKCPNLKELILAFASLKGTEEVDWSPAPLAKTPSGMHLQTLQMRAPNLFNFDIDSILKIVFESVASLKKLRLGSLESRRDVSLQKFLAWLEGSQGAKKVLEGLEELDLSKWTAFPWLFTRLAKVEFQNLKILRLGSISFLSSSNEGTWTTIVFGLLTSVSSTLVELTLESTGMGPTRLALPDLPKLMSFRNCALGSWTMESMGFVLKTPKLEILDLTSFDIDDWEDVFPLPGIEREQKPHAHLKTLRLSYYAGKSEAGEFGLIGRIFPNLVKVVCLLRGSAPDVRDCLIGLTNLEHLKVLDLTVQFYKWKEPSGEDRDLSSVTTVLPDIPALEILTFRANKPLTGEMFTSGFVRCPKLKRLDVSKAKLSPVAAGGWDAILESGHGIQIIAPKVVSFYDYPDEWF